MAEDADGKPLPESSGKWQPLNDHLQNVVALAHRFAEAARPGDAESGGDGRELQDWNKLRML